MQHFSDWLIENYTFLSGMPTWAVYLCVMTIFALLVILTAATIGGILTYIERRVAGRIQSRVGPNRVGPQGILQFVADGIKLILKEDLIPKDADAKLFRMAPYIVLVASFLVFVTLPIGEKLIIAELNIGIFYILAVTSMVVIGLLMAGWASNSKWTLFGGLRSAAQIVSYEIPTGIAILALVIAAGSLNLQDIVRMQGWAPIDWFIFRNPFLFIVFFLFFTSGIAEINRIPFDLPEAESELVSGYNTEYSGIRFGIFFIAEFANILVLGLIGAVLFLGGWQTPFKLYTNFGFLDYGVEVMGTLVVLLKASILSFIIIQLRWTFPRLRVDQLMIMCWQYFVPIGFICMAGSAVWEILWPHGMLGTEIVLSLIGLSILCLFIFRVIQNLRRFKSQLRFNPFI
jgi:NADH-quinone oxidoreductase subunit H